MEIDDVVLNRNGEIIQRGFTVIRHQLLSSHRNFEFRLTDGKVSLVDHGDFLWAVIKQNLFSW